MSVAVLKLSQIEQNPTALRTEVNKKNPAYLELKDSIRLHGLQNAISVRRAVDGEGKEQNSETGEPLYRLVDGLHRHTACADLGMEEIPVNIVTTDESNLLAAQIAGNAIRVETTKAQFAQALKQILQHGAMTETQLAEHVGKGVDWLRKMLSITKLAPSVQKLVDEGKIVVNNAIELAKLPPEFVEENLTAAMTDPTGVFGPKIATLLKEIRQANREGRKVVQEFVPQPTARKSSELKTVFTEYKEKGVNAVLKNLIDAKGITDPYAAAIAVLEWTLQMDEVSVAAGRAKWEAEKAQKEADKAKAKKEKEDQKAKEAQEALAGM